MESLVMSEWVQREGEWGKAGPSECEADLGGAGAKSEALFLARKSGRGAPNAEERGETQ